MSVYLLTILSTLKTIILFASLNAQTTKLMRPLFMEPFQLPKMPPLSIFNTILTIFGPLQASQVNQGITTPFASCRGGSKLHFDGSHVKISYELASERS